MNKMIALAGALSLAFLVGCSNDEESTFSCDQTKTTTSGTVSSTTHTCFEIPASSATAELKAECAGNEDEGFSSKVVQGTSCPSGAVVSCAASDAGISGTFYFYGEKFAGKTCADLVGSDDEE